MPKLIYVWTRKRALALLGLTLLTGGAGAIAISAQSTFGDCRSVGARGETSRLVT